MAEKTISDKYKVPSGLRPLLEAFARETIRAQPEDLIEFGQLFFDTLQQHLRRKLLLTKTSTAHKNKHAPEIQNDLCHWIQLIVASKMSTISLEFIWSSG